MTFDLYAWKSPRDLDGEGAAALVESWNEGGGDPAASPFEPSTDVGWFYRELTKDEPEIEATSDALPNTSKAPLWITAPPDPPPARVVRIPVSPAMPHDLLDSIFGSPRSTTSSCTTPEPAASICRSKRWPPTRAQHSVRAGRSGPPSPVASVS